MYSRDYFDTKTFYEFITDNPDVDLYADTDYDVITKDIIEDWFYFRKIVDNEKFAHFFNRKLRIINYQFNQLYRFETIKIDPFVANYMEKEHSYKRTMQTLRNLEQKTLYEASEKDLGTIVTESESTMTPNLKSTKKETSDFNTKNTGDIKNILDLKTVNDGSTSSDTSNTTTNDLTNRQLNGTLPMSDGYVDGFPENLNWENASTQGEAKNTGTVSDSGNSSGTSTNTETRTGTDTQTQDTNEKFSGTKDSLSDYTGNSKTNKNETETHNLTKDNNSSTDHNTKSNGSDAENSSYKEILTGRNGILPSQALEEARNYMYNTNSMKWLLDQLEVCFLSQLN